MDKSAHTLYPIHDLLKNRWSPRAFAPDPIEPDTIMTLLEAARWSPSAANLQPWRFIVAPISDREVHGRVVESLSEKNRMWAASAPLLVIAVAKRDIGPEKPNRWHAYDLGQSVAHLSFQAASMGLWVHQMGGIDPQRARELFAIPDEFEPLTAVAIGRRGDLDDLPEEFRDRERQPRTRTPIEEIAFSGTWGNPVHVGEPAGTA